MSRPLALAALALLPTLALAQSATLTPRAALPAPSGLVLVPGDSVTVMHNGTATTTLLPSLGAFLGGAAPFASNTVAGLMRGDGSTLTVDPLTGIASVVGAAATPLTGPVLNTDTFLMVRGSGASATPYSVTLPQLQVGTAPLVTAASCNSSQALTFPASGTAAYDLTLTGACAVTLAGGTAGQVQTITLFSRQDATAGRVLTLPPGVKWSGGNAPTPNTAAGGIDVFTFTTPDAGATVLGSY